MWPSLPLGRDQMRIQRVGCRLEAENARRLQAERQVRFRSCSLETADNHALGVTKMV
jgi:hypothetical protein